MRRKKITSSITAASSGGTFGSPLVLYITLVIVNFCYTLPLLLKPMDSEADAYGRAQVYFFADSGIFKMEGDVWLPLYQTFINLTQFLPGDEIQTPRYLATAVSSLVPILVFILTKKLTKNTSSSFLTALLYIFFPLFREISTVTLTETFFLVLLLSAFNNLLQGSFFRFVGLFILSQMTRFEAWFLIPWLSSILATKKTLSRTTKLMLLGLCVIFPLFYSAMSFLSHGTSAEYLRQMNEMALRGYIEGRNNFPVAMQNWAYRFWNVFPVGFAVLAVIGGAAFLRKSRVEKSVDYVTQFVFAIAPLFLFLMLPIQVFLPFRDWLPSRYFLIPTTLLFPLIGNGIQQLLVNWNWRRFWQWYLLGLIFLGFELYSLVLNTHGQISTYSPTQFSELYQTLDYQVKKILSTDPDTQILVYKTNSNSPDLPDPDVEFVRYFLFPHEPWVQYVHEPELSKILQSTPEKKIIITTTHFFPSDFSLRTIFKGDHYQFLLAE